MSAPDRRRLVDRKGGVLSIRRQCELLGIARSGVYRSLPAANDNDLVLMRRIDNRTQGEIDRRAGRPEQCARGARPQDRSHC
jgi:hypothetical protein